jgi:hypothetical protein
VGWRDDSADESFRGELLKDLLDVDEDVDDVDGLRRWRKSARDFMVTGFGRVAFCVLKGLND